MSDAEIKKGLAGVVVDDTAVSVNAETNSLLYRGYPLQELAAKCSFEEDAYLLWNGELPTQDQLARFTARERVGRAPDPVLRTIMDVLPTDAHPMGVCRTVASVLGARHPWAEDSAPGQHEQGHRSVGSDAGSHGVRSAPPARPGPSGTPRRPRIFGQLPVDDLRRKSRGRGRRSFNASMTLTQSTVQRLTFPARVVSSTLSDLHSAVTAASGALKGPLQGGANEAVMRTFDEIGIRSDESLKEAAAGAKAWMEDAWRKTKKVMGLDTASTSTVTPVFLQ